MKRFFCLLMSLMCLCLPAAHATGVDAEDYTVAGKLVKQLWAGSGFSATVSVEIAAKEGTQAMSTLNMPRNCPVSEKTLAEAVSSRSKRMDWLDTELNA